MKNFLKRGLVQTFSGREKALFLVAACGAVLLLVFFVAERRAPALFSPERVGSGFGAAACVSSAGFYCEIGGSGYTGNSSINVQWDYSNWGGTDTTCPSKGDSRVVVKIINATTSATVYTSPSQVCASSLTYTGPLAREAGYYVQIVGTGSGYVYSSSLYTTMRCSVYGSITARGCGILPGGQTCGAAISWNANTANSGAQITVRKPNGVLLDPPSFASPNPQPDSKSVTYAPAPWSPNAYTGGNTADGVYTVTLYRYRKTTYWSPLAETTMTISRQPVFSCTPSTILLGGSSRCSWTCYAPDTSSAGTFTTGGAMTGSATLSPGATTQYVVECLPSTGSNRATVTVIDPQLTIIATPSMVTQGSTTTLSWSATQVTSATLTGPGINQSGVVVGGNVATTTIVTPALTGAATYTLTVNTVAGTKTKQLVVGVQKKVKEK